MSHVPLTVAVLTLAACGGSSTGDSGGGSYTLGLAGTLSGEFAEPGLNQANAVKLAVSQANAGRDLGFTLKYAEADDAADASAAAQELIEDESVVAVVGPTFSAEAKTAAPLYSAAGLTTLTPSASGPDLTTSSASTFFRDVPSDDVQGEQAAAYIARVVKAKKVYSISDKSVYARLTPALDARMRKDGLSVVSEGIAPTTDYGAIAGRVARTRPDFVYYGGYFAELALLATALRSAGYDGPIGSGDGSKDDKLVELAGKDADGIYVTCACSDPNVDPDGATFASAYRRMFGVDPGAYSAEAYDAANAIIRVLRELGPASISRSSVLAGVRSVDYKEITKQVAFRADGEPVDAPIFVYRVRSQRVGLIGRISDLK